MYDKIRNDHMGILMENETSQPGSWCGFTRYRWTPFPRQNRRIPPKIAFRPQTGPFQACLARPVYFLSEKYQMYIGPMQSCAEHAHHALQIMIALDDKLTVSLSTRGEHVYKGVMIGPNVPHKTSRSNDLVLLILIDAETAQAKRLKTLFLNNGCVHELDDDLMNTILKETPWDNCCSPSAHQMRELYTHILEGIEVCSPPLEDHIDERLPIIIDYVRSLEVKKVSSKTIAKRIFLSESRLIHLFKSQTGIPIRRYLLWERFKAAVQLIVQGANFTQAAHSAGFADSAHLSRTAQRLFGMSLSSVFGPGKTVTVIV